MSQRCVLPPPLPSIFPCGPASGGIKVYFCLTLLYPIRGIKAGASGPEDLPCDPRSFFKLRLW